MDSPKGGRALDQFEGRARGLVEVLAERLNVDGFMLLAYDASSDLVKLDAAKLKQIYGDS